MNAEPAPRTVASRALRTRLLAALSLPLSAWSTLQALPAEASPCRTQASPGLKVVELYTSEGCSSCPPADRWLSSLKGRADVLALGFHVTYWDRLGWPDRLAAPSHTERQHAWARAHRSPTVYTPQVLVDGEDWRRWPGWPAAPATPAATHTRSQDPALELVQAGERVTASLAAGSARRLSGYWAVLEDQHATRVPRGENAGRTLTHDHVVRLYQPVEAWRGETAQQWVLPVSPGVPGHPRRVAFVVADPVTMKPLQAAVLAIDPRCGVASPGQPLLSR
jgi:hypothetical protein